MVDFKKLREAKAKPKPVNPRDIFNALPKPPGINDPCLSGYHPHPLYVVCLLGLQARAGAGALRRRSG